MIIFLTILWVLIYWMVNVTLSTLRGHFNIKAPFKLRSDKFNDCKDPIYKLEKGKYSMYYSVYKYELGYEVPDNGWFFFIPLAFLFSSHTYVKNGTSFGAYDESDIESGKVKNLKEIWDKGVQLKKEKLEKEIAFNDKLNAINIEFTENYKV